MTGLGWHHPQSATPWLHQPSPGCPSPSRRPSQPVSAGCAHRQPCVLALLFLPLRMTTRIVVSLEKEQAPILSTYVSPRKLGHHPLYFPKNVWWRHAALRSARERAQFSQHVCVTSSTPMYLWRRGAEETSQRGEIKRHSPLDFPGILLEGHSVSTKEPSGSLEWDCLAQAHFVTFRVHVWTAKQPANLRVKFCSIYTWTTTRTKSKYLQFECSSLKCNCSRDFIF